MKQKFYILRESDTYNIYKVDNTIAPSFEDKHKDNIILSAPNLQELIQQFDKQTQEKLELKKKISYIQNHSEKKEMQHQKGYHHRMKRGG